jgi:TolB-like protein
MGRGGDFDGRGDASVRVQASRVRTALEEYYAGGGAEDALRIVLPRGTYVPVFERQAGHPHPVARVPGVAVMSFTSSGDEPAGPFARSLSETLVQHLARQPDIRVVGPTSAGEADGMDAAGRGGVSSVLSGHVMVRDGRLRLTARLTDARTGEVLWTTDEAVVVADLAIFETEERWSREVSSTLGDATGLVVRQEMRWDGSGGTEPELAARLAFYSYVDRGTASAINEAVVLLDEALVSGHRSAALLAMRAALANASYIYGIGDKDAELDRAEALARDALAIDGSNVHAHLVLGSAARDRGQWQVAIEHADTASRLAPFHPSYLVGAGITLSGAGEWARGSALIREAHRLHPGLSGHTHAWLAMAHLVEEDYARALSEASLLPSDDGYLWGPLYRGMALSALGYADQAQIEAERVRAMRPDVLEDLGAYLSGRMRLTPEQQSRLCALL